MKKLLLFGILTFSLCTVRAQSWVWARQGIPSSQDAAGELTSDRSLAIDPSGNIYVTGAFNDTMTFGSYVLGNYRGNSLCLDLVKYDSNGNVLWARQSVQATKYCYAQGATVAVDKAGYVYVAGQFCDTVTFGGITMRATGWNMFLAKYNSSGSVLWVKKFSSSGYLSTVGPASIATDAAGFVYLTGSYIDSAFLGPYKVFSKHNAAYIAKFDSSGNIKWLQHSVAPNKDYTCAVWPSSMALDKSANIYITGRFADTITFGTYTLIASPMLGSLEAYTVKYDSAGNVKWASGSKMVGNNVTASSWGRSIAIDGHGNPYITGLFIDTVSFDTFIMRSSGQGQTYLVKYDNNNGKVIWGIQTHDLSSNNWWGYSVTADTLPKGGAYIAASAYEYSATSPYKVKIQNDTFQLATTDKGVGILIHFDSASNVLQGTMFSEGGEDDGDAVMAVSSGRTVYMAGDISGVGIAFGNDTLKPGSESPFLARWSPFANNLTGINNIQETAQSVKLFPNPNNGKFTLEVKSEELITKSVVEIYNMVGEQIYCSSLSINNSTFTIDIIGQPIGIYLYRVLSETDNLISEGKFVIE